MMRDSFFAELKRRHVWRVGAAYAVTAWLLLQLAAIVLPAFDAPDWVLEVLIVIFVIFFPVALILAWFFEATSEGVRRTPDAAQENETEPLTRHSRRIGHFINAGIIVVLVAAVGVLAWQLVSRPATTITSSAPAPDAATKIPAKSIAVLPFENQSADKKNAYFVAGIHDLILTKLAGIGDLKVIARTSSDEYTSHPDNLDTIRRQLGVATILEGAVQKANNKVLINVRLIDTDSAAQLWAKAYTRTLDNIFDVQGEVAEKVAAALNTQLSPKQTAGVTNKPTQNAQAYNLFLRAEYDLRQGHDHLNPKRLASALPLYRKAVAADPDFALAWARLSYAESLLARLSNGPLVGMLNTAAQKHAAQALKLAPDLAATQLALGFVAYYGKNDFANALKHFRAALAQQPNDTKAMAAIGYVLRRQHRYEPAIHRFQQALSLDPRNAHITFVLARTYWAIRRYDQAVSTLRSALALDPGNPLYQSLLATAIVAASGNITRALAVTQGDAPRLKSTRVRLLTMQRRYDEAIALLKTTIDNADNPPVSSTLRLAQMYWLAGDYAQAQPLYEVVRAKTLELLEFQKKSPFQTHGARTLANLKLMLAAADRGLGNLNAAFKAIAQALEWVSQLQNSRRKLSLKSLAATLYAQAGRADLAVPLLVELLTAPGGGEIFSPALLHLSGFFDPIRDDPRFQALLKKYPAPSPATTSSAVQT